MVSYKALNTAIESPILNRCDTIWNSYAGERVAPQKSVLSNRSDTIGNIYASEGVATPKSRIFNRCDTIWDIYAGERVATAKSMVSNCCDTVWNCIVCFFALYAIRVVLFLLNKTLSSYMKAFDSLLRMPCHP